MSGQTGEAEGANGGATAGTKCAAPFYVGLTRPLTDVSTDGFSEGRSHDTDNFSTHALRLE